MADNVKEEIVVKKSQTLSLILYTILMITAFISAIFASIELMTLLAGRISVMDVLAFVFFGGSAWLMWWGKDFMRLEYEYSFTNGVVDVAQVINNRRRKELISFRTREVELVAPVEDERLDAIMSRPGTKKIRAVLNRSNPVYFAAFKKNEVSYLVYFQPSQEFLRLMRIYNERNVVI